MTRFYHVLFFLKKLMPAKLPSRPCCNAKDYSVEHIICYDGQAIKKCWTEPGVWMALSYFYQMVPAKKMAWLHQTIVVTANSETALKNANAPTATKKAWPRTFKSNNIIKKVDENTRNTSFAICTIPRWRQVIMDQKEPSKISKSKKLWASLNMKKVPMALPD